MDVAGSAIPVARRSALDALFDPESVALVGASRTPGKWGYELAVRLLKGRERRRVELVSTSGAEVAGHPTSRSLADVPGGAELVISAVPPEHFESVVEDGIAAGAKAFVAVTAGLGELGSEGRRQEERLVERIRGAGARLLGPNCLGVLDTHSQLMASAWFDVQAQRAGSVAVITQSGTVGLDFELLARRAGLGFSRFVSVGNQSDIRTAELLSQLVDHEPTRLVVVYCETFVDGRAVFSAAEALVRAGKPVLMLAPGASPAATRAARSHTGSLTSARGPVEAACDAAGVHLLSTTAEAVDLAQMLLHTARLRGDRIGIVADGGGYGVLTSDLLDSAGLTVPLFSSRLQQSLTSRLGPSAATQNPVDLAAAAAEPGALDGAIEVVVRSGEVDGVVVTGFIGDPPAVDPAISSGTSTIVSPGTADEARRRGIPLVVQALFEESQAVRDLSKLPVATYRTAGAVRTALVGSRRATAEPPGVPPLPDASAPIAPDPDYFVARALIAGAGIEFAPTMKVGASSADLERAASALSFPVVIKATHVLHKSDVGGVALDIPDLASALSVYEELVNRLGTDQFAMEEMVDTRDGVELILGVQQDPQLGPVALVGLGGVFTEVFADAQLCLAPVTIGEARRAIERLRGHALLTGARARAPVDVDAAARCLATLSDLAARHPEVAAIEVNPLLVTPTGAVGLDARVIVDSPITDPHHEEHP